MHVFSGLPAAVGPAHPLSVPGPLRWSDLVTQWRVDPLVLAVVLVMAAGYTWYRLRARRAGIEWATRRDVMFVVGTLSAIWVSCGVAQARATQVEWVWIAQILALLLVVPLLVLCGQPVQLTRLVGNGPGVVARVTGSRFVRVLSHPLVGPALVPITFCILLFGGAGQHAAASAPAGWLLHLGLLLLGAAIALPLVDGGITRTSFGVALALGVGFVEFIADVFPGIVLRLVSHPVIPYFFLHSPAWTGGWVQAQQNAGSVLWVASEILDVPFIVFLAVRWARVDAAEAKQIDARLDAAAEPGEPALSRPWFLDDPQLRDRFGA